MEKNFYTHSVDELSKTIALLKHRGKAFVAFELFTFLLSIAFVAMFTVSEGEGVWMIYAAFSSLVLYVVVRRLDVKNGERIDRLTNRKSVYEKELKYLDGDFSVFDNGERYVDPKHEYTFDMDIFGKQSLYNRICRAVTSGGADRLAEMFSTCALGTEKKCDGIGRMRKAIKELAEREPWRTEFLSFGQKGIINTSTVTAALDEMTHTRVSPFAGKVSVFVLAWLAIVGFWVSVALSIFTSVSANLPVWWGIAQFAIVYVVCSAPLHTISKAVGRLHKQLKSYAGLIRLIIHLNPVADDNRRLVKALTDSGVDALTSFSEMESILDGLDRRGNVLGMALFNIMFLSDLFLVRRFFRWQKRYAGRMKAWIEAVSEMDARVSLATFRSNELSAIDADVVDDACVVYEAYAIRHPFLGQKAVRNDFIIADGNYYIVTGANMAGKSTFLRSLGVNYILAMIGAPVFASKLRVSVFSLFSSMRTSDDLAHGISYFNAELLRLRQLINACKHSPHTLIILDEILKGTNSLDKLNGSRMFLKAISSMPVSGVIATHDLELSRMADENPSRFHNFCFEIRLSDEITYTYKIAPGVARNQNATYLLRNIIKDVPSDN